MQDTKVGVMVASERPELRHLLKRVVEREPGVSTIGQAENAVRAMALARTLRPNVVLVDSDLPHITGREGVRLSRIGGLDAASSISQQIPGVAVMLLNSSPLSVTGDGALDGAGELYLSRETANGGIRFPLADLLVKSPSAGTLTFVSLQAETAVSASHTFTKITERTMALGGAAVLGGIGLMFTLILAGAGILLALFGVGVFLLGLAGRAGVAAWSRVQPPRMKRVRSTADKGGRKWQHARSSGNVRFLNH